MAHPVFHFLSDRHNRRSPLSPDRCLEHATRHELNVAFRQNPIILGSSPEPQTPNPATYSTVSGDVPSPSHQNGTSSSPNLQMVNLVRYPKETETLTIGAPRATGRRRNRSVIFRIGHLGRIAHDFLHFLPSMSTCPSSQLPRRASANYKIAGKGVIRLVESLRGPLPLGALASQVDKYQGGPPPIAPRF